MALAHFDTAGEVVGALISVFMIWMMTGGLLLEALKRLVELEEVGSGRDVQTGVPKQSRPSEVGLRHF